MCRVLFRVSHESLYRYDMPVRLAPHVLRLHPRPNSGRLLTRRLSVDPLPVLQTEELDGAGNTISRVSFHGETSWLHVVSEFELEVWPPPPIAEHVSLLPLVLEPTLSTHPEVRSFARGIAHEVAYRPIAFLDQLARALFTRMAGDMRPSGAARAGYETLALGGGACRDLTALFLEACAVFGLSGRFVSGYHAQPKTVDAQHDLHAWAEVFLPGIGYRGWDPMHGLRVGTGYVALCAATTQAATMPIEGGLYFDGAVLNSTLDCAVRISTGT